MTIDGMTPAEFDKKQVEFEERLMEATRNLAEVQLAINRLRVGKTRIALKIQELQGPLEKAKQIKADIEGNLRIMRIHFFSGKR